MWFRWIVLALFVGALGCTNQAEDDTDTGAAPVGPELVHVQPDGPLQEGETLTLTVEATDDDGVVGVTLYYRTSGLSAWEVAYMVQGEGDTWSTSLEANDIAAPGLEYYFKGIDDSSFQAFTLLPAQGPGGPLSLEVRVVGRDLPFTEDFEGATNGLLKELDWKSIPQGFEGYEFALTQSESNSPTTSIWHRRGPDGLAAFKDWVISPPLSFEGQDDVQVTWWQKGRYMDEVNHSLWISTTTPDPKQEGAFVKVTDLDAPTDEWSRSTLVDLSAWAGEQTVYLAWYYEGQYADDWYIDDVDVRGLRPDLQLVDVSWTPTEPGGQTTVALTLENQSPKTAENIVLTLDIDPAEGSSDDTVNVASLAASEQVVAEFVVDVAVDHLDNAYLPFSVDATDGTDVWSFDERLVVGDVTTAEVDLYLFATGYVTAWLGVGDPDAPELFEVAFNDVFEGEVPHSVVVDVTEFAEHLPATASNRWWLQIESAEFGYVDRFELVTGDFAESANVPQYVYESFPTWVFLPEPPDPVVVSSTTSPSPLSPGDAGTWTLQLLNYGEATIGDTSITLSSSDPSLSFVSGATQTVATGGWIRNQSVEITADIEIASDKKDSLPIAVDITIQDDLETITRSASVFVPWPVLQVTRTIIDDSESGNNDGVLDPNESAELEIHVANIGDRNSFSLVNCTLSQSGGLATSTLTGTTANYGVLSAGETEDEDGFGVTITSGTVGDDLQFEMSCTDGTESYVAGFTVTLGIPPWNLLSTVRDSGADALNNYEFDLLTGQFRSDGTTLDISLVSSTVFDSTKVFVEAWASSPGSDYAWYQFVVQGGSAKVRGYDGKFHDLATLGVSFPSTTEVVMSVDIASLGLLQDTMSIGFASGFCGGTDYYCDHYPDYWGDPYNAGFYTSEWFDLTW